MNKFFVILMLYAAFAVTAKSSPAVFVIVTVETAWPDGVRDQVGEVEQVIGQTNDGYIVTCEGRNYTLPKTNGRIISAEEAALNLISVRQKLYAQIYTSEQPSQPTQRNGQPLPSNWIDPNAADAQWRQQQIQSQINAARVEAQRAEDEARRAREAADRARRGW